MSVGPAHYAVVAALVFSCGLAGMLTRRHGAAQLLALGVMLTAPVIALAGFSETEATLPGRNSGEAVALVLLVVSWALLSCGAGVLVLLSRRRANLDLDVVEPLEG